MRALFFGALVLAGSLWSTRAHAQVCDGSKDDTAFLQALVDSSPRVDLDPTRTYCINARVGVNIGNPLIHMNGARIGLNPGCAQAGFVCRGLQTRPGTRGGVLMGPGEIFGDLTPAPGWSILLRIDSASDYSVKWVTFRDARSDAIWVGGNLGSHRIVLEGIVVDRAGRNGISVVNTSDVKIFHSVFSNTLPGADPGACIDIEGNPGDTNKDLLIADNVIYSCRIGIYDQKGLGNQGRGHVISGNSLRNNSLFGLVVNGVIGLTVVGNTIESAPWLGPGNTVPLAGTIAGSTNSSLAADVVLANNLIIGTVHNQGTPQQVVTGNFRLAGVKDATIVGNTFQWGAITTAGLGAQGDLIQSRNR